MNRYTFAPIQTRSFPAIYELKNKWIFGAVKSVINVSEQEDLQMVKAYKEYGIDYHFFPLKENVADIGWNNILEATKILVSNIENEIPTIVHCHSGNHRSPLVVESAYFALYGSHFADEYKGCFNHLLYDVEKSFLPLTKEQIEKELLLIKKKYFKINL